MHSPWRYAWLVAVGGATVGMLCIARAQVQEEGEWTVFRGDGASPLLSWGVSLQVPGIERDPTLHLLFGFTTAEPLAEGTFYDSFSLWLQEAGTMPEALLFTADRSGLAPMPPNPGGLVLAPADLEYMEAVFADIDSTYEVRYAYSVSYELPPELSGRSATLLFDFFDNLNAFASMAYVGGIGIDALPSPILPAPALLSSAAAEGPYATESEAFVDVTNRLITLPLQGAMRFFRARSEIRTRLLGISREGGTWALGYAFDPTTLVLESAADPSGLYLPQAGQVTDLASQSIRVPRPDTTRFFRIRSDAAAKIERVELAGDSLVVFYSFAVSAIELWSAAAVAGPYAKESQVAVDATRRIMRLPIDGGMRFFRLSADAQRRITRIERETAVLRLCYE
jgi:hypothetical protein